MDGAAIETLKVLVNLGLHLEYAAKSKFQRPGHERPYLDRVRNYYQYLDDEGQLDDAVDIMTRKDSSVEGYSTLSGAVWSAPGVLETIRKGHQVKLELSVVQVCDWSSINLYGIMDVMANHGVSPEQFRSYLLSTDSLDSLDSFTNRYWWQAWQCSRDEANRDDMAKGDWTGIRALIRWMCHGASTEDLSQLHLSACDIIHSACAWFRFLTQLVRRGDTEKHPQFALQMWLTDLMEAGVDLEAYGQLQTTFKVSLDRGQECSVVLSHGPRPEDWRFQTNPGWEECWSTTDEGLRRLMTGRAYIIDSDENLRESMPGEWVDSEDDSGCDEE
jgi:hypothetical protein